MKTMPGFAAEVSLSRPTEYRGLSKQDLQVDNAVYPAQGCEWWRMSICGPHVWPCGLFCAPARAVSKKACIDCMTVCMGVHTWVATTSFCAPCASSFC